MEIGHSVSIVLVSSWCIFCLFVSRVYHAANKYIFCFHNWKLLQLLEVSFLLRKAATVSTPICEISEVKFPRRYSHLNSHRIDEVKLLSLLLHQEGGMFSIKTSTTLKTAETKFKVTFSNQLNTFWIRPYLVVHENSFLNYFIFEFKYPAGRGVWWDNTWWQGRLNCGYHGGPKIHVVSNCNKLFKLSIESTLPF